MYRIPLIAVLLTLAAGCGGGDSDSPASRPQRATPDDVPLRIASWDEIEQSVAAARGRVVVVDVWSTWCEPCMREFPNLVALQKRLGDRVACISVSVDYEGLEGEPPESFTKKVQDFLTRLDARLDNVVCSDPSDEIFTRLKLPSIPAVMVYDRDGQLHTRFELDEQKYGKEGFSYEEHIVPLVEQLLEP